MNDTTDTDEFIGRRPKTRHRSADVQSLDSWTELTNSDSATLKPKSTNFGQEETLTAINESGKNELLLSPSKLEVKEIVEKIDDLDNTREPKITRVKLNKSENTRGPDGSSHRGFFFSLPENASRDRERDLYSDNGSSSLDTYAADMDINRCTCVDCVSNRERRNKNNCPHLKSSYHSDYVGNRHAQFLNKHKHIKRASHHKFAGTSSTIPENDIVDQSDKMKNKLMSVWNNVKYGWTLKTKASFQEDSPIFLLGCCYHKRPGDEEVEPGQRVVSLPSMELFKRDFQSRLWFTYRRDFQALPNTSFTTDCGWGCMLRSSQMMLAQAFVCHYLGRDWRVYDQTREQETFYRQIISWFGDSTSDQCPFSVHRLAELGKSFGKQPGEWYGPSSVAYIVRDAVNKSAEAQTVLKDFCVYVAQDCTVYKQDIIDLCTSRPRNFTMSNSSTDSISNHVNVDTLNLDSANSAETWKRPVIILIPVRLGGEQFNPIYGPCIKNLIANDCCLGLIGGKPKHSLYFIGWQGDKLIYLDPHLCQDFVDTSKRDFKIETFHCFSPWKISINKIDPSATVGFYCRTREDFDRFVEHTEQMVTPAKSNGIYPLFVFSEGKGKDMDINGLSLSMEKSLRVTHVRRGSDGKVRSYSVDSEEYVVL